MEKSQDLKCGFIERLQYYMNDKGINDNQMTVKAGLSVGLLGKAKSTGKGMSSINIEKILLAYPDLSPRWLLTGEGSMLCSDSSGTISGDISNSAVSTAGPAINTVGQHSVELQTENHHLQQRIADLERLLDEKERLISILLSKQ